MQCGVKVFCQISPPEGILIAVMYANCIEKNHEIPRCATVNTRAMRCARCDTYVRACSHRIILCATREACADLNRRVGQLTEKASAPCDRCLLAFSCAKLITSGGTWNALRSLVRGGNGFANSRRIII